MGRIASVRSGPRGVTAEGETGSVEVGYWSARAVRVTWRKAGGEPSCRLAWLEPARERLGEASSAEDEETARVWLPGADVGRVRLRKDDGGVELLDAHGKVLTAASAGEGADGRVRVSFPLRPEERLFGLGLQLHALDQRGRKRFLKINADPKDDSGNAHVVVPLLLSTGGYGVFVNTHEYTWWDLGADDPEGWWVEVPGGGAEVCLLLGSLREQVREYLALTGRPALPPKWGLGFWYRPKSGWDEAEVKSVLEEFARRDLPCQVVGLEPSWQTHAYPCSYVWNREQWPDPAAFVGWLDERGMKLNLWEHAYVHETSPIHGALKDGGLVGDATVFGGLVPDFTLPEARRVFLDLHEREHLSIGVAGFKLDECDGADYTGGWFLGDEARFPGGMSGAQMHNVLGYLYQRTMHEAFEGRGRRSYFLCRANHAGGQAQATCNYSDWYGLREYVRMLANAGFGCSPWCPEVRHIDDTADFARRGQVAFTSWLAMINAWSTGMRPWDKGGEAEAVFRQYARLREALLPYLYAEWEAQGRTGLGLTRALAVDFQEDERSLAVDDEYLLGRWLLVAPVMKGEARKVYLPPGRWMDWWTGEVHAGSAELEYHAPVERLPMFLREGAVVPMLGPGEDPFGRWRRLRVLCWPADAPTDHELYDDDGETTRYLEGEFWRLPVRLQQTPHGVQFGLGDPQGELRPWLRRVVVEVRGMEREPGRVLVNARPLPELAAGAIEAGADGWAHVGDRLLVGLPASAGLVLVAVP